MKNQTKPNAVVAIFAALTIALTSTLFANPNTENADVLNQLNQAYAQSGITEQQMAEENAVSPSQRGLFLLTELGVSGTEIAIEGGAYRAPHVAVSRPGGPDTPFEFWNIAWTAEQGFFYQR